MGDRQECIRWCRQYGPLATQMICPTCNRHCREQVLDCAVDGFTSRYPVKVFCIVVPLLLTTFNLENKAFYCILTTFWRSKYENEFENQIYVAQIVRKNERH